MSATLKSTGGASLWGKISRKGLTDVSQILPQGYCNGDAKETGHYLLPFEHNVRTWQTDTDWSCMVFRPLQHNIGYTADGFYRSKDPTNGIKVGLLKEMLQRTNQTTKTKKYTYAQERNGLRRRKRRIACHRWVCWWAWSPILEVQTRGQLSHGQALRLLRG